MKTRRQLYLTAATGLALVLFVFIASTIAEKVSTREYEINVPAAKSDTQRMIEAYERLSDQYLTLVQTQLGGMSATNRDVLTRLDRIEQKLDTLSARLAVLEKPAPVSETPKTENKEQPKPENKQ